MQIKGYRISGGLGLGISQQTKENKIKLSIEQRKN